MICSSCVECSLLILRIYVYRVPNAKLSDCLFTAVHNNAFTEILVRYPVRLRGLRKKRGTRHSRKVVGLDKPELVPDVIINHIDSAVLIHSQSVKHLNRQSLSPGIIFPADMRRADMSRHAVLVLVLVIVETLVRNYLRNRKSPVIDYTYGNLAAFDELFNNTKLLVRCSESVCRFNVFAGLHSCPTPRRSAVDW